VTSRDLKPLLPGLRRVSSPAALKVLIALLAHADSSGRCHPSWRRLSEATGLSRAAVAKAISRLEAASLITRTRAPRGRGVGYLITRQGHPGEGSPAGDRSTAADPYGLQTETRKVSARRPISEVYARRPSDGQKPRQLRVPAADPRSGGGLRLDAMEGMKEPMKVTAEGSPPASGPPALTVASGPEASGLGAHPGEAPPAPTSVASRLVDTLLDHAPFVAGYEALMLGLGDLRALRAHLETVSPNLAGQFTDAISSALGGRERLREAVREAEAGNAGWCWSPRVGRVVLVSGRLSGFLRGVLAAWAELLQPGPPQQGQATGPLHEVAR